MIDGSFPRAIDRARKGAAIIRAVLGLVRGVGLRMLAECVEDEAELIFLRLENCTTAHDYLIAWPALIARFAHYTHVPDPAAAMPRVG